MKGELFGSQLERTELSHIVGDVAKITQLLDRSDDSKSTIAVRNESLLEALEILDNSFRRFVGLTKIWDSLRPQRRKTLWRRKPRVGTQDGIGEEVLLDRLIGALSSDDWPREAVKCTLEHFLTTLNLTYRGPSGKGFAVHQARPELAYISYKATRTYENFRHLTESEHTTEVDRNTLSHSARVTLATLGVATSLVTVLSQGPDAIQVVKNVAHDAVQLWEETHRDDIQGPTDGASRRIRDIEGSESRAELPYGADPEKDFKSSPAASPPRLGHKGRGGDQDLGL